MSYRTYFRLCLVLPLAVIALFEIGFLLWGHNFTKTLPELMASLWINTKQGFSIGLIQYLLLALFLGWGIGKWSLKAIKINAALTPVYYAAIMFISLMIYGIVIDDVTATQVGGFAVVFSIIYGYFYVMLVFLSYFVLRKANVVKI